MESCKDCGIKREVLCGTVASAWKVQTKAKELGEDILIPHGGLGGRPPNSLTTPNSHAHCGSRELCPQCGCSFFRESSSSVESVSTNREVNK